VGAAERLGQPSDGKALAECECGAALSVCVVRFQRRLLLVREEGEGSGACKGAATEPPK